MLSYVKNSSGTWQAQRVISLHSGGSWVQPTKGFVKQGGSWVQFYALGTMNAGGGSWTDSYSAYPTTQCTLSMGAGGAGSVDGLNSGNLYSFNWVSPTTVASYPYYVKVHVTAGAFSSGSNAADTWIALSSGASWLVSNGSTSSVSVAFDLYLADQNLNTLATSTTWGLTAGPV